MQNPTIQQNFAGNAHVFGDDVDTDGIIPGKYTKTLDLSVLARHVLEDVDPSFCRRVNTGDVLVAGQNFGCGSSREQAPLALKSSGVAAVVAVSFARIFFRNAVNIGLPVLEIEDFEIFSGDRLAVDLSAGTVHNVTRERLYSAKPLPPVMIDILNAGGLVQYMRENGDYRLSGRE